MPRFDSWSGRVDEDKLLTPDGRHRVSLRYLAPLARHYFARREGDGTIVLTPAVVMSVDEVRKLRDGR